MGSRKVTVTRAYIDQLKADRDDARKLFEEVRVDREKFRTFFVQMLRDQVTAHGKQEYYSAQSMVLRLAKLLNDVKPFYWSA